jgi:prepilin signal peptidase PulO-like enzyme (type II secretory pathway)
MDNIEPVELVLQFSGIMLCFFMPGYVTVLIITKKRKVNPFLAVLLAYLLGMLIYRFYYLAN